MNPSIKVARKLSGAMCLLVLGCIFVAGFWPLSIHRKNDAEWVENGNGLQFSGHSYVLSSNDFQPKSVDGSCSFEIFIDRYSANDESMIFAFSTPKKPIQFGIMQAQQDMFVVRDLPDVRHDLGDAQIVVDGAFHESQPLLISITSNGRKTDVYLNGMLAGSSPHFALTAQDLNGTFVLGNSPVNNRTWHGLVRGLAVYNRALTPEEVSLNFANWTNNHHPWLSLASAIWVGYDFRPQSGTVVHSVVGSGPDLYIPRYYSVFHPLFLKPFWKEFQWDRQYREDLFINIVGFIPLGLTFCAFLSFKLPAGRAAWLTTLAGFLVSLTIEILQGFIARDSGTTDLITNTLGTALGVLLYKLGTMQIWRVKAVASKDGYTESVTK